MSTMRSFCIKRDIKLWNTKYIHLMVFGFWAGMPTWLLDCNKYTQLFLWLSLSLHISFLRKCFLWWAAFHVEYILNCLLHSLVILWLFTLLYLFLFKNSAPPQIMYLSLHLFSVSSWSRRAETFVVHCYIPTV